MRAGIQVVFICTAIYSRIIFPYVHMKHDLHIVLSLVDMQIKLNLIWTNCAPISIISIFASTNLNVRHVINFCEKLEDPRIPRMIRLKRCRKGCWPNDIPLSRLYNLYLSFNFPSLSKLQTLQVAFIFLYFLYSNYFICLNLKVVFILGYSIMRDQNYSWGLQGIAIRVFWSILMLPT